MTDELKRIKRVGNNSKYVIVPKEWGNLEDLVKVEILNENELRITRVDVIEKGTNGNEQKIG